MAEAAIGVLPRRRPIDDLTEATAAKIAKITEQLDALNGTVRDQTAKAKDSVNYTQELWKKAASGDTEARKESIQRFRSAGGNLAGGVASRASIAGNAAMNATRASAAAAAAETRKIGIAARNVAGAPVAVGGAAARAVSKATDRNWFFFLSIALIIHAYDWMAGFPRLRYGLETFTAISPANLIGVIILGILFAVFRNKKTALAILSIISIFFILNILLIQDYIIHLYAVIVVLLWVVVFRGLTEESNTQDLIELVIAATIAYILPFAGYLQPGLASGTASYFINPILIPVLFLYGVYKFQKDSQYVQMIFVVYALSWLFVGFSLAQTNNDVMIGSQTITKQHYLTAAETLKQARDGSIKFVSSIINTIVLGISGGFEEKVAHASGIESYGRKTEGQQEGLILKISSYSTKKVDISQERGIDIYATLVPIRRLDEKTQVTAVTCVLENRNRGSTSAPLQGDVTPKKEDLPFELFANQPLPISCSFPNKRDGNEILKAGSASIKLSATYTFSTDARLRTYFMTSQKLRKDLDEAGSNDLGIVARRYQIPTTNIITESGNAPVTVGIGGIPEEVPIGISDLKKDSQFQFIGVSLTNEKSTWRGKIARVTKIELTVPEGVELEPEEEGCMFEPVENPNDPNDKTKYRVKSEILARAKDLDDGDVFGCASHIVDANKFVPSGLPEDKAFSAHIEYDYKTELTTTVEVTKSTDTTLDSTTTDGSSTTGATGNIAIGNGKATGQAFTHKGGSDGPTVSCDYYPTDESINVYEKMELYERGSIKKGTSLKQTSENIAKKYGIDPAFIPAFAESESAFNAPKYSCVTVGKSSLLGCGWYPDCSKTCACDSKWVWSDELQVECAMQTLKNGYNGEGVYKDCLGLDEDKRWACVFCHYQGNGGTSCEYNTKIRALYCRWSAYYAKQQGILQ